MSEKTKAEPARERVLDEALEETFPASDPPFFVGAGAKPPPAAEKKRQHDEPGTPPAR